MFSWDQGKSLSIICGALKWLRDHQNTSREKRLETLLECKLRSIPDSEPAWVRDFYSKKYKEEAQRELEEEEARKQRQIEKLQELRRQEQMNKNTGNPFKKFVCSIYLHAQQKS